MGILNVTPDSMSDGGMFVDVQRACQHAQAMVVAGADVIDVGGESTRPGATPVDTGTEQARVVPVIEALVAAGVRNISIDTRHGATAHAALRAGASWVNDVQAGDDAELLDAARDAQALVLMHQRSVNAAQRDAHGDQVSYGDVVADVTGELRASIERAERAGVSRTKIIADPGLGFGKSVADNLRLLRSCHIIETALGVPVLMGASRKRFIGAITHVSDARDRDAGSVAAALVAVEHGARVVRVHDVLAHRQALQVWWAARREHASW
jgi:dihydropteroate synthase